MGILLTILLGALVGYLAAKVMGRREGFLASALIGIIGAVLAGFVSKMLGFGQQSGLDFDASNLLWSLAGAIAVVAILNAVQHKSNRPRI